MQPTARNVVRKRRVMPVATRLSNRPIGNRTALSTLKLRELWRRTGFSSVEEIDCKKSLNTPSEPVSMMVKRTSTTEARPHHASVLHQPKRSGARSMTAGVIFSCIAQASAIPAGISRPETLWRKKRLKQNNTNAETCP